MFEENEIEVIRLFIDRKHTMRTLATLCSPKSVLLGSLHVRVLELLDALPRHARRVFASFLLAVSIPAIPAPAPTEFPPFVHIIIAKVVPRAAPSTPPPRRRRKRGGGGEMAVDGGVHEAVRGDTGRHQRTSCEYLLQCDDDICLLQAL